jgi:hypothetical protein
MLIVVVDFGIVLVIGVEDEDSWGRSDWCETCRSSET